MKILTNTPFDKKQFQKDLLDWYTAEKRDLPWRLDQDPYKIWVSEIMLQQTKVETVIPYFNRFVTKFPSAEVLASAPEQEVLKEWEGLGYYSRARNLHAAVKEVVESYNGKIPSDKKMLSSLSGIGPYTLGAILSIAFNQPEPAVDGNVMRVCSRLFSIWDDISKQRTRKAFEEVIVSIISEESPSDFNQAVMELGAIICTPKSPGCMLCPVQSHCQAFRDGTQRELPIKTKNKKQTELQMGAVVLQNEKQQYLIQKRPEKGMLANLWEFPMKELQAGYLNDREQLTFFIKEKYGLDIKVKKRLQTIRHVFSHVIWNISVFEGTMKGIIADSETAKILTLEEMADIPFSVSQQKIVKQLQNT